jgi:hypothetical protein
LTAAEAGRIRTRPLRAIVFAILADVLRTASPAPPPAGECPEQGSRARPQSLATELSSEAGRSFTAALRNSRRRGSGRRREGDVGPADLRRLTALAAAFPAPQRQVFTLRKVYGLRPGDIASALGLTEPEVERCLIAAALACASHCFDPNPTNSEATSIPGNPSL